MQITHEMIEAVWQMHARGAVRMVARTASGSRNETYVVNREYVLRVNTRDPQFAKFRNERRAYDILAGSALPVPRVLVLDESRQVIPYDYLIVTRLPGVNLAESWQSLDPAQVARFAWEAGRWLAQMHAHSLTGFGALRRLDDAPFSTWNDYFRDYATRYLSQARERGVLPEDVYARLLAVRDQCASLLEAVTTGVLVHSDYHYENILQHNDALSGLLDFEWALSGDPSFDFVAASVRESVIPGSEKHFLAGYTSTRPLDADHPRRVALYRLFLSVETAATQRDYDAIGDGRATLADTVALLDVVEREMPGQERREIRDVGATP